MFVKLTITQTHRRKKKTAGIHTATQQTRTARYQSHATYSTTGGVAAKTGGATGFAAAPAATPTPVIRRVVTAAEPGPGLPMAGGAIAGPGAEGDLDAAAAAAAAAATVGDGFVSEIVRPCAAVTVARGAWGEPLKRTSDERQT